MVSSTGNSQELLRCGTRLLLEQLAVVAIVFANELVDFGQVGPQRKAARDLPGLLEYAGILDGGFVLHGVEIRAVEALHHMQISGMAEAAGQLGFVAESIPVPPQAVVLPV